MQGVLEKKCRGGARNVISGKKVRCTQKENISKKVAKNGKKKKNIRKSAKVIGKSENAPIGGAFF